MKFASIFFTASAVYIRGFPQILYDRARNTKFARSFKKAQYLSVSIGLYGEYIAVLLLGFLGYVGSMRLQMLGCEYNAAF